MDRLTATLPTIQSELALTMIKAAQQQGARQQRRIRVVLVLLNYGEISTEELLGDGTQGVDALLMAFMPHFGQPVAETLFGIVNPGGKLPYTVYPNNYTDLVDFLDMSMSAGPGRGYRYYRGKPLFPFGFGLSYTTFDLVLVRQKLGGTAQPNRFDVRVTNTGKVAGTETVQNYFVPPPVPPGWTAPIPLKRLLSFRKLHLQPHQSSEVSFSVSCSQMMLVDNEGVHQQLSGNFTLLFTNGHSQTVRTTMTCP